MGATGPAVDGLNCPGMGPVGLGMSGMGQAITVLTGLSEPTSMADSVKRGFLDGGGLLVGGECTNPRIFCFRRVLASSDPTNNDDGGTDIEGAWLIVA